MARQPKQKNEPQDDSRKAEIDELTKDLQRTRADFENYRKRVEAEKEANRQMGQESAIVKILPVIDNIERAISHVPAELSDNAWAKGVIGLTKHLDKALEGLGITRIPAAPGTEFNPELHDAIQIDNDADGDREVIAEELQAGYLLRGRPIRHSMVKVTRE